MDLGAYVLGGLELDEAVSLEEHLEECASCRDELAELTPLPGLLAIAATVDTAAPADLRQRVLERPRRRPTALLVAGAALLAAVAGGAVVTALDRSPAPDAVVALHGEEAEPITGDAELAQVAAGVQVVLDLAGTRPADEGYYHAWLDLGEGRASAGTFVGTPDGRVQAQLLCGGQLEDYDSITITWHGTGGDDEVVALHADLPTGGR